MTAEHLHVAAKDLLRPSCIVKLGDFFPETQAGLLIADDRIVRDGDPSVVQSQRLLLAVWMTADVHQNLVVALFLLFLLGHLGIDADPGRASIYRPVSQSAFIRKILRNLG